MTAPDLALLHELARSDRYAVARRLIEAVYRQLLAAGMRQDDVVNAARGAVGALELLGRKRPALEAFTGGASLDESRAARSYHAGGNGRGKVQP